MPTSPADIRAVEAAADLIVQAFKNGDISALHDIVTDATLVMAPARPTAQGRAVIDQWRGMAQAVESFRLLSTDVEALAEGVVRDVGTLSLRRKPNGERSQFRYVMVWQKVGSEWKLSTMAWNREQPSPGAGRRGQPAKAPAAAPAADDDGFGDM